VFYRKSVVNLLYVVMLLQICHTMFCKFGPWSVVDIHTWCGWTVSSVSAFVLFFICLSQIFFFIF